MSTLSAGNEIDSYCTKCKLDLNHRIVAMVGPTVKRVECLTCGGQHNYRKPKAQKVAAKKKTTKKKRATSRAKKAAPAAPTPDELRAHWEAAIAGRTPEDFTAYSISGTFATGQLLRHKKFGDGVVSDVIEDGKIFVIFESGPKLLVHAR